ncbi:hypothetical protein [Methylocystis echinoides]|uniref:hypothetical protein n=1 Tax=Methylocystis echinoides TaxID=29468 RepID=UPI0034466A7C
MRGVAAVRKAKVGGAGSVSSRAQGKTMAVTRAFGRPRTVVFAALLAGALAPSAVAGPRTIDDCEAIKDPNAYNLCLASFGPMRGQHGASYPGVAAEGEKRGGGASRGGRRAAARHLGPAGASMNYSSGGRVRMEFTPGR